MNWSVGVLRNDEKAIFTLRELYQKYGYTLYKVSKFEEYDLYARNKNFLVSQNVLTFTDTNGKLLALKPDVTLSIIKNIADLNGVTHKLCYNETVYRTPAGSDGFREIMQTGLECIGTVDRYAESEVIMLAMKSLETISADYILDLSHRGIIDGLLEQSGMNRSVQSEMIRLMESKNTHAIQALCHQHGLDEEFEKNICALTELYAPIEKALPFLSSIAKGEKMQSALDNLQEICEIMGMYGLKDRLFLDFSVVSDADYYDGISFKGFIHGIPESVLSGGRYDRLLSRLGKKSSAIGFAVYLDRLERFENDIPKYDVDAILFYDEDAVLSDVINAQKELSQKYSSVVTAQKVDPVLRASNFFKLTKGGIEILERYD